MGATGMVGSDSFITESSSVVLRLRGWLRAIAARVRHMRGIVSGRDTPLPPKIAAMTVQPNVPEGAVGELPKIIFAALGTRTLRASWTEVSRPRGASSSPNSSASA